MVRFVIYNKYGPVSARDSLEAAITAVNSFVKADKNNKLPKSIKGLYDYTVYELVERYTTAED